MFDDLPFVVFMIGIFVIFPAYLVTLFVKVRKKEKETLEDNSNSVPPKESDIKIEEINEAINYFGFEKHFKKPKGD